MDQKCTDFGQGLPSRMRPNLARIRTNMTQRWPISTRTGLETVNIGMISIKCGQVWTTSGGGTKLISERLGSSVVYMKFARHAVHVSGIIPASLVLSCKGVFYRLYHTSRLNWKKQLTDKLRHPIIVQIQGLKPHAAQLSSGKLPQTRICQGRNFTHVHEFDGGPFCEGLAPSPSEPPNRSPNR